MSNEGCKGWRTVAGLRSKWFWLDQANSVMGAVYTFYSEKAAYDYQ
jgi:hypothetical protein